MRSVKAIRNITVVTMDETRRIINDAVVAFDQGIIIAVGKEAEVGKVKKIKSS